MKLFYDTPMLRVGSDDFLCDMRRGAGVVERGGLENRCTRKGTVGSNPTLSAISFGETKTFGNFAVHRRDAAL